MWSYSPVKPTPYPSSPLAVLRQGQTPIPPRFDEKVEQWIIHNPLLSLCLAAGVGAGLAWVLKTRH